VKVTDQKDENPKRVIMPPKGKHGGGKAVQKNAASGEKFMLDVCEVQKELSASFLASHPNLSLAENKISLYKEIVPSKLRDKNLTIDPGCTLVSWEPIDSSASIGWLTIDNPPKRVKAFKKMMPLVDPYYWLRFKERPSQPFIWNYQKQEIVCPENQGYVDCVASCMASKIKTHLNSPHFCDFYGAFRAVTDVFYYNLEDDFEEFRFTNWFWKGLEDKEFGIRVIEKPSGRRLTLEEIQKLFKPDAEFLHDDTDDEDDDDESSSSEKGTDDDDSLGAESLDEFEIMEADGIIPELKEVDLQIQESDFVSISRRPGTTPKTVHSMSTASDDSYTEDYDMHAELYNMPVAIQFLECFDGTMDDLLEMKEYAPIKTEEQELIWKAWLFQVCAALTQLQNTLRLTHNDLHTCNVLWKKTSAEFLLYSDTKGRKWKIPTHGYIFSIIDYGRAIFSLNNFTIVSSDYNDGHDAYGMYNFGPILEEEFPRIFPNKSFDLCRLACSLLRGLYHRNPASNPKGQIITKEGNWEVRETEKDVFNLLWTWLRTKSKKSVLETEFGEEKFPGFDLYAAIAKEVGDAVPEEQIGKTVFNKFLLKTELAGNYIKIPM
jgi:hypothetical protein